jgi:hypothetical protein
VVGGLLEILDLESEGNRKTSPIKVTGTSLLAQAACAFYNPATLQDASNGL